MALHTSGSKRETLRRPPVTVWRHQVRRLRVMNRGSFVDDSLADDSRAAGDVTGNIRRADRQTDRQKEGDTTATCSRGVKSTPVSAAIAAHLVFERDVEHRCAQSNGVGSANVCWIGCEDVSSPRGYVARPRLLPFRQHQFNINKKTRQNYGQPDKKTIRVRCKPANDQKF